MTVRRTGADEGAQTHTHTTFNGPLFGTTWVSLCQKTFTHSHPCHDKEGGEGAQSGTV